MRAPGAPTLASMSCSVQLVIFFVGVRVVALCSGECSTDEIAKVMLHNTVGWDQTSMLQASYTSPHVRFDSSLALRTHRRDHGPLGDPNATARAQALRPVAWVHIPKAGSSFLNVLYHNQVLCPGTPKDAWLADGLEGGRVVPKFLETYPPDEYCPGSWSTTYPASSGRNHVPIGSLYAANAGHFVVMLRQPEQRIISAYNYQLSVPAWMLGWTGSLRNFAETFQGSAVKMLARTKTSEAFYLIESSPPSVEEDNLAVQRLHDGFAFVGLTDEWELSVCLFHAMFGGECVIEELYDMRPGPNRSSEHELYDLSALEGFIDVHDGRLYAEAQIIFGSSSQRYGVTKSTCSHFCT